MAIFLEYKLLTSIVMILILYPIKHYLALFLKIWAKKNNKDHRYIINTMKNLANLVLLIAMFLLWGHELQKFALSIAAFIVAIVIATREYIQCFIGFLYVTSTSPFRVGDWVQTGTHCGEVTSTDWAKLTMLEIDQNSYSYTGRTLFIPNNQLITLPIKNLNFLKRYVCHSFTITMENDYDPYVHKSLLLEKAQKYCEDFHSVAERYNAMIERSLDVTLPGPEPSVTISTTDLGRIKTCFSIFCPTEKAMEIEEQLTADFFYLKSQQKSLCDESKNEETD